MYKAQSAVYACYLMCTLAASRLQDVTISSCNYNTRLCHTTFAGREDSFLVTMIEVIILSTKKKKNLIVFPVLQVEHLAGNYFWR